MADGVEGDPAGDLRTVRDAERPRAHGGDANHQALMLDIAEGVGLAGRAERADKGVGKLLLHGVPVVC